MIRYAPLAMLFLSIGCGARSAAQLGEDQQARSEEAKDATTDGKGETGASLSPGGPPIESYDGGKGEGSCVLCAGDSICAFCKLQGANPTYRCVIPEPAPVKDCWNLSEQYEHKGKVYTCYYCD